MPRDKSRNLRAPARPAPPPPRGTSLTGRTAAALGLLVVIVVAAIAALSLGVGQPSGSPSPGSSDLGASPGDSAAPSASPASAVLEALIPKTINGTTMTTQSATDAKTLSNDPSGRALDAGVLSLGKQPSDLEIAVSYDGSGSIDLSIIGFRISGITPEKLEPLVLATWVDDKAPGVTSKPATMAGTAGTQVSYGDNGSDEFVFVFHDAVFVVETADESLAGDAVAALTGAPAPSGAPTASPASSGSPTPS